MIIFNTLKKAQHYVKFCNRVDDWHTQGYEWSSWQTWISGDLVLVTSSGDGCGCGCDTYRYSNTQVIGRIKGHDTESSRSLKLRRLLG